MNDMTTFIARRIIEEADKSIEAGQKKYRAYFVKTRLYKRWKLYRVQVGAFKSKANAEKLASELKSKGYQAVII